MPSVSEKQRKFMGADLGRAEKGMKTKTGMSVGQLKDFAAKPVDKPTVKARPKAAPKPKY